MGDIHGEHDKLIECLQSVKFDYHNDILIQLGDVCDRGGYTFDCVEELLKIRNLISIKGNHDDCFLQGLINGNYLLYNQGAMETLRSYIDKCESTIPLLPNCHFRLKDIPQTHQEFWKNQRPYFIDESNDCFVHGGFNRHHLIEETGVTHGDISDLWWDRDLLHAARSYSSMKNNTYPFKMKNDFKEVFIGHTPTQYFGFDTPQKYANIWDTDTGSGKGGVLTIMNVETKEYFQSK